jgi:hypothetical protein
MTNPEQQPFTEGAAAVELDQEPHQVETLRPMQVAIPTNPGEMLYLAMSQGKGFDELQKFMDFKDRWEAGEARKAFVLAMSKFKANDIHISKDKANLQYSSRYTTLGNLVETVTPYLSQNGLSAKWDLEQSAQKIKVTCIITHSLGHSEQVALEGAPDTTGQKNAIQQIKSTITYLKAATFESICGLASSDANMDDDGNGFQQKAPVKDAKGTEIPQVDVEAVCAQIAKATTIPELVQVFNTAFALAQKAKDRPTMDALLQAQKRRQAELKPVKKEGGAK